MTTSAELALIFRAQDAASGVLNKVQGALAGIGKVSQNVQRAYNQSALAIGQAIVVLERTTALALEDEKSQVRLQQSVIAAGLAWQQYGAQLEATAERGLKLGFGVFLLALGSWQLWTAVSY